MVAQLLLTENSPAAALSTSHAGRTLDAMHALVALVLALSLTPVAQSASLVRLDVPPGAAAYPSRQRFEIASAILGETRRVFVALPESFAASAPSRRYPVIVVTDGEGRSAASVVIAATELSRSGLIPETIVAGIENLGPMAGRVRDLTPPGLSVSGSSLHEGGDRFLDFIERELLPAIDRQFRGAPPRVLVGHSSGGILATYAAATRDAFRLVVALDTPAHLGGNWLGARLMARAASNPAPLRLRGLLRAIRLERRQLEGDRRRGAGVLAVVP